MGVLITPRAKTTEQANAFIGAVVRFNPEHPDNQEDHMVSMVEKVDGEVVASIVEQGKHWFTVAFDTPMFSGTARGILADRFVIEADA